MLQLLARRGSAPPLVEEPALDVRPAAIQFVRATETLHLHDRVRAIDEQLVAVVGRPYFAANDAAPAAEKADHVRTIGTLDRPDRGWCYPKPLQLSRMERALGWSKENFDHPCLLRDRHSALTCSWIEYVRESVFAYTLRELN